MANNRFRSEDTVHDPYMERGIKEWHLNNAESQLRPLSRRLRAVGDTGHYLGYNYQSYNEAGDAGMGGVTNNGFQGGWVKQIGTSGVLELAYPNFVYWGDSHPATAFVFHALGVGGVTASNPIQAGIGGQTSEQIVPRFETDVLPHDPLWLMVSMGQNDYQVGVPTKQTRNNVLEALEKIRTNLTPRGCNVVWFGPSPSMKNGIWNLIWDAEAYRRFREYDLWLQAILPAYGVHYFSPLQTFSANYARGNWDLGDYEYKYPLQYPTDGVHMGTPGWRAFYYDLAERGSWPAFLQSLELYEFGSTTTPPAGTASGTTHVVNWSFLAPAEAYTDPNPFTIKSLKPSPYSFGTTLSTGAIGVTVDITSAYGGAAFAYLAGAFVNYGKGQASYQLSSPTGPPGAAAPVLAPTVVLGTNYTLLASDHGKTLYLLNGLGDFTLNIPAPGTLPVGFKCKVIQAALGIVRIAPPANTNMHSESGMNFVNGLYHSCDVEVAGLAAGVQEIYLSGSGLAEVDVPFSFTVNTLLPDTAANRLVVMNAGTPLTLTLPTQAQAVLTPGFRCRVAQGGTGQVTLAVTGSDIIVNSRGATLTQTSGAGTVIDLELVTVSGGNNTWQASGAGLAAPLLTFTSNFTFPSTANGRTCYVGVTGLTATLPQATTAGLPVGWKTEVFFALNGTLVFATQGSDVLLNEQGLVTAVAMVQQNSRVYIELLAEAAGIRTWSVTGVGLARKTRAATLVAGTVVIADATTTAGSTIRVWRFADGGTVGASYSVVRNPGVGYTIQAKDGAGVNNILDTSVIQIEKYEGVF